jgi:hypothetical protein
VNTEPLPGSLATVTSPPIMRASLRVMARPSPVPPKRCAVVASAWLITRASYRKEMAALGHRLQAALYAAFATAKLGAGKMLDDIPAVIVPTVDVGKLRTVFHVDLCHVKSPIAMRAISLPLSSITQTTQP